MMRQYLKEKQATMQQQQSDFYTARGTHVYFKDASEIDVESVINKLERKIPEHLLSEMEMIVVGQFEEFEERNISAFYENGILHISNIQQDENDMLDDLVHEVAHSVESINGFEIYGDEKLKREFLSKRERLHQHLSALGYDVNESWFKEVEYDPDFESFLFETVGKQKLRMICTGLFINAYAPVSLREYFATGFTDFYLHSEDTLLRKLSPQLFDKVINIHKGE